MKKWTLIIFIHFLLYLPCFLMGEWLNNPSQDNSSTNIKTTQVEPISLINAEVMSNSIVLSWEGIGDKEAFYNIYRSDTIIDKNEKLKSENMIQSIPSNQTIYTDKINLSGNYYYAITTKNKNNDENKILIAEQNYTLSPIEITIAEPTPTMVTQQPTEEIKEQIPPTEETNQPLKEETSIKETNMVPVVEEPVEEKMAPPEPEMKPIIVKKKSKPKKKIVSIKKISPETRLENVLQKYYFKEEYKTSIKEFKKIINLKNVSPKTKAKAFLFLGRAYYQTQNYKAALKHLVEAREYYTQEADFWLRKTLDNLK